MPYLIEKSKSIEQDNAFVTLKALVFLYAFEESVDCLLLSCFCDDSNLHISLFKYVLSTMGVSKESISKFLIGFVTNFHQWEDVTVFQKLKAQFSGFVADNAHQIGFTVKLVPRFLIIAFTNVHKTRSQQVVEAENEYVPQHPHSLCPHVSPTNQLVTMLKSYLL